MVELPVSDLLAFIWETVESELEDVEGGQWRGFDTEIRRSLLNKWLLGLAKHWGKL
jgi:hypothetical protein